MKFLEKNILVYLVFICSLLVLVFVNVWQQTKVKEIGYEVGRLKEKSEEMENENIKLKLKIDELKSPKRVEEIAVKGLGMIVAEPEDVIVFRK
ncbi:cell division protein FtsL [bacterium]|nr:cell division protein FtsL [bacterium]MBU1614004.1 cell division protein FtsL [bacterium]